MDSPASLKDLERKLFQTSTLDGIIDIHIGCVLLIFALAPLLSNRLGDFWSSAVFLPIWGAAYLILRFIRERILQPRIGSVEYGSYRKGRLKGLNIVLLIFNFTALFLGILSFFQFADLPGYMISLRFSIIILVGFSLAAYMLELSRFYIYGILIAAGPIVGEYLYQNHGFSHHGFPFTFGILSGALLLTGILIMVRIIKNNPLPGEESPHAQ